MTTTSAQQRQGRTVAAPSERRVGRLRWAVFGISSGVLAVMTAVLMLPNLVPPIVTAWGGPHFIHDVAFTTLAAMMLTGLAAQLGAPTRRVAAMLATLVFPAVFVLVVAPTTGFVFPPLIVMLALAAIATASHPASRDLLRPTRRPDRVTLALAGLWAVPGVVYAVEQLGLQRDAAAADPHAQFGHWAAMGVFALAVALLAVTAARRPAGWQVAAGLAAVAAALVGAASVGFPTLPSSLGVGWGLAAIAWAIALGAASTVGSRSSAVTASRDGEGGMRTRVETRIERPIDEVFAFIADPTNDPQWCPNVQSVEQIAGDGPGAGASYHVVHDPMGKPVDLRYDIVAYEPARRLVMRQDDHLGTFTTSYLLEADGGGATRLVQASQLRFKGFGRVIAPVIRLFVMKGNREQFARLKALLESRRLEEEHRG